MDEWDLGVLTKASKSLAQNQRRKLRREKKTKKSGSTSAASPATGAVRGGMEVKALSGHLDHHRWPLGQKGCRIRLGSDCSGMESAKAALDHLGLRERVTLEFCSDKDPLCRKFLEECHSPKRMYKDVATRDVKDVPKVVLYFAGFPCQPWSSEGKGEGRRDRERGRVFDHIAEYIKQRQPKMFFLENVKALTFKRHKKPFKLMLNSLRAIGQYFVTWRILNAVDFGIPQSRPRLFIVGLLRSALSSDFPGFPWPKAKNQEPLPLERFLCGGAGVLKHTWSKNSRLGQQIQKGEENIRNNGSNPQQEIFTVDAQSGRNPPATTRNRVPCLTRARAGGGGYFLTRRDLRRFLCVEEVLNLQGLPVTFRASGLKAGLSDRQIGLMAGNAIPTNVLTLLFSRMLHLTGMQGS